MLRVFRFISFRAVGAAVTAIILSFVFGPMLMRALKRQSAVQVVRDGPPITHAAKGTTPTMGGLIFLMSAFTSCILWGRFSFSRPYMLIAIFVTLWMGVIGLIDDTMKLAQKRRGEITTGRIEKYKLAGQLIVGVALGWYLLRNPLAPNLPGASTTLPFFKYYLITFMQSFGFVYII